MSINTERIVTVELCSNQVASMIEGESVSIEVDENVDRVVVEFNGLVEDQLSNLVDDRGDII